MIGAEALAAGFVGGLAAQLARLPAMGLEKAVLEPLSRRLFRRATARAAPYVSRLLDWADPLMPQQIAALTPAQLDQWLLGGLESLTGEEWPDPSALEPFWNTYDPRINAEKTQTQAVLLKLQQ